MKDKHWVDYLTGTPRSIYGEIGRDLQEKAKIPVGRSSPSVGDSSGEGITAEGFFGFVFACIVMYWAYSTHVSWEWYWWVGAFLGVFVLTKVVLNLVPFLTKILAGLTLLLIAIFVAVAFFGLGSE